MSRFSQFIHQHFGTSEKNESVLTIIARLIPEPARLIEIKEIISDVVAVIEGTGQSGPAKKALVTMAVKYALKALHIQLPDALVSYLIEEAVLLLKGGKPSPSPAPSPIVPPAPPVVPTVIIPPVPDPPVTPGAF